MNQPKISVVIPAYNAEKTLEETVDSVIAGTYENLEILIVDDRSKDNTWQLMNEISKKDARIKCYQNEQNSGVSKSRNFLINIATGEYIAFLDSDDTWEPNKLEFCVKMIEDNPHVKAVGHALRYLSKQGKKVGYISVYPTSQKELQEMREKLFMTWVFPSAFVGDRETIIKEGGFREDWRQGEDTDLFIRIAYKYGIICSKEPLGNYRILSSSITDQKWLENRLSDACAIENIKRMIKGEPELSLAEYRQIFFDSLPPWPKFNKVRKLLALRYKRRTGQAWINQEFISALFYAGLTTLLDPMLLLNQFKWMKSQEKRWLAERQ